MTEIGRIGVKAVSTVIAAVIVLTIFLGLASAIYAGIFQLGNESSNLVKREAERAMEAFFQIYWLNETHVVLFNNHSSVPIKLLYWVRVNPASGSYTVYNLFNSLDPAKYTVQPSGMKIVDIRTEVPTRNRDSVDRVVSEKGSTFEVTDAPTELHTLIYFTPTEKIVRPGFNGRLTTFVIPTGPDFGGGDVTVTCINILQIGTTTTIPCTAWGISFVPSSTITVPAGRAGTLGVDASIPSGFTSLGFYVVRLRLQTSSFTREYAVKVIVSDFSASISPATLTLGRAGCALPVTMTITTSLSYTGHINVDVPLPPTGPLIAWSSPNPVHPPAATIAQVIVERRWTPPYVTAYVTTTLTVSLEDGSGSPRTASFVVVHRGATALATAC
jgi:hypothetical protein